MERFTAVVVLALGGLFLNATVASATLGRWETTVGKVLVLLLIVVAMWPALGHLRRGLPQLRLTPDL